MESTGSPAPPAPAENPSQGPRIGAVLAVLMVGTFLAPLDSSIVNIALPVLAQKLDAPLTSISWVATSYLLTSAALLLSMGRLGDVWGLRNLYVWGLAIFGVGSIACALSTSLGMLVASRVLQAVGAAMLFAAGPAIVAHTIPPNRRGSAFGIITLSVAAGLTAGPALGGVLVHLFGWPSIFIINIPLVVVGIVLAWRILPEDEPQGEPFDVLGAVLAASALIVLLGALTNAGKLGFLSVQFLGAMALVALLLGTFLWWEARTTHPMVDLRLFRSAGFSAGIGAATLAYLALFSVTFSMPFYLTRARAMPEEYAGLLLTMTPLAMALLAPIAGRTSDRVGSRALTSAGLLVLAAGLLLLGSCGETTALAIVGAGLFVVGTGMAIFQSPNTAAVMRATPRGNAGVGSAFIAEARNVGMALGIALTAALIALAMGPEAALIDSFQPLTPHAAEALIAGMALTMRICAGVAVLAAALSWFVRGVDVVPVEHMRSGG
jgi:EmrB/QacA subfamily drug resistance transporter